MFPHKTSPKKSQGCRDYDLQRTGGACHQQGHSQIGGMAHPLVHVCTPWAIQCQYKSVGWQEDFQQLGDNDEYNVGCYVWLVVLLQQSQKDFKVSE